MIDDNKNRPGVPLQKRTRHENVLKNRLLAVEAAVDKRSDYAGLRLPGTLQPQSLKATVMLPLQNQPRLLAATPA